MQYSFYLSDFQTKYAAATHKTVYLSTVVSRKNFLPRTAKISATYWNSFANMSWLEDSI
jgi:hypothetical protein